MSDFPLNDVSSQTDGFFLTHEKKIISSRKYKIRYFTISNEIIPQSFFLLNLIRNFNHEFSQLRNTNDTTRDTPRTIIKYSATQVSFVMLYVSTPRTRYARSFVYNYENVLLILFLFTSMNSRSQSRELSRPWRLRYCVAEYLVSCAQITEYLVHQLHISHRVTCLLTVFVVNWENFRIYLSRVTQSVIKRRERYSKRK